MMGRMQTLTGDQRADLRARIAAAAAQAITRAAGLERDFASIVTGSADAVRDDEHDPEGATIAWERAQVASLLDETRSRVQALERAAQRMDQPDADRCEACGQAIGYPRLRARPMAMRCVGCAR